MPPESTPAKGGGMSLYANLLDPSAESAPGTISRAPVVFKQSSEADAQPDDSAAKKQQLNAASLRFQPTKRPQLANQKPKAKPTLPKATAPPAVQAATSTSAPNKSTIADWAATEDDDFGYYMGEKRQRGGRKKRKKNREERSIPQNWDDIYDPSRPNNYEAYRHSDEKILEVREWKDRLYAHRMRRSPSMDSDSDYDRPVNRNFAPPPSFAPPPNLNDVPPPPPASVPDDASGEDAFARRARMVQNSSNKPPAPGYSQSNPPPPPEEPPAPSPPGNAPPPHPTDTFQPASATISRAPVRYTLPPAPADIPASEAELEEVFAKEEPPENENDSDVQNESNENAPRSLRPGQKGFAERLLSKYGWTKGSGLGADGSGIAKPLQVKVEKRKKRPDSEGGGFVTPAGRGTIVIILLGMLDGMDLDAELSGEGGGLMQEIGEECSEKYGSVERVYIARDVNPPVPVFVKFTSPLSALRAVNALEGRIFNGNPISARFFDPEKFEQGNYVD
ncbi:uncharacterized protein N7469_006159 [Penicillium citrinum]|uniref:G-patch domain-containing protein n=1 Tax=Penicillium citrinum TaxID=5077 RepID=A0A9W9NXF5_PENCI|nr:uncharacterized protein N7469_006159 [Penicillium citrinum]KAJ5231571.1 hypothetical protein N7469_006159 [Penicillium citrinum]